MIVSRLKECPEFRAGDHTTLRELLRPVSDTIRIGYSLAYGFLKPGASSKRHRLASSEVYYFLSGRGEFRIGDESTTVGTGTVVYVPAGGIQSLSNTGTEIVEFLCLVDPAWKPEDEEILE